MTFWIKTSVFSVSAKKIEVTSAKVWMFYELCKYNRHFSEEFWSFADNNLNGKRPIFDVQLKRTQLQYQFQDKCMEINTKYAWKYKWTLAWKYECMYVYIYLPSLNQLKFTILFRELKNSNLKNKILIKTHEQKNLSITDGRNKSNKEPLGSYFC